MVVSYAAWHVTFADQDVANLRLDGVLEGSWPVYQTTTVTNHMLDTSSSNVIELPDMNRFSARIEQYRRGKSSRLKELG